MLKKVLNDFFIGGALIGNSEVFTDNFPNVDVEALDASLAFNYGNIYVTDNFNNAIIQYWITNNLESLKKMYNALFDSYEPLYTFESNEESVFGRMIGKSKTASRQYGKMKTTETTPNIKTSHYTTTYESTITNRLESYDTNENTAARTVENELLESNGKAGTETTSEYENTVSMTNAGKTVAANDVNANTVNKKERRGEASELLKNEINFRAMYDFIKLFSEKFIKELTTCMYKEGDFVC